jgi:upstream activation factor subunit UAF30
MPAKKKAKKAKKTTKKVAKKKKAKKAAPRKKAAPKKRKAAPKKKAAKKVAKKAKPKVKRKPNPAFMREMSLSPELGAIVGARPMPRTEVTKKLWEYIKKNGLQDKVNRRMINADDRLLVVFGGKKQVSMFDMTKLIAKHMK